MASVIKLKRSSTPGAVPAGGDLEVGEVAVNLADRVIFAKQAGGSVVRIGESALANTNARINLLNTNLTGTNTALRTLITNNSNDITAVGGRVDLVNTNLTATNTAIRLLNTNTQSALDTQEAKQASNLANTNSFIKAQLANTNTRINNLSTSLSGDFMTKANPESNGHHAHTGRMSVSTNLLVSGNTHIDGNLTVEGEVTYISTTTLEVMDPLIKLASNNQTDVVDTGFYALYDEGSTAKYAGIFRDASDGIFKVFSGLQADPTVTVDTTGTGYALAQLDANIDGGSF